MEASRLSTTSAYPFAASSLDLPARTAMDDQEECVADPPRSVRTAQQGLGSSDAKNTQENGACPFLKHCANAVSWNKKGAATQLLQSSCK